MNDMAFGGGSEMLRDGDTAGHWTLVESGMRYNHPPYPRSCGVLTFTQDFHPNRTLALARTVHYAYPRKHKRLG